ncbi:hypothetical protein JTE90_001378 [Oedothorax gibbosus]|uniref:RRM domain-containing protein n=1 Tax=Oedothorax gibbosus TaxID=931172 RepID=A0AAV6VFG6_9ARAC|nr:hypothetical protein JTE90_001378 [Oedothorax gibbosus]
MKNDARFLLNKKKAAQRATQPGPKSTIDARKILNRKRAQNQPQSNRFVQNNHGKFTKTPKGIFTKSFTAATNSKFTAASSSKFAAASSSKGKVPDKRIKVTTDGNILITAKSKDLKRVPQSVQRTSTFSPHMHSTVPQIQKSVQWVPADIEMDNIEHIGINDLLDMESLPPAMMPSSVPTPSPFMSSRMQNSMVADHITPVSALPAKVVVTNLNALVTKQDILDLFGVVGILKAISMPQPGTAIIEFFNPLDATKACNIYDNRLLDGQLMKCYLDSGMPNQRSSVSHRLGGQVESWTPAPSIYSNKARTMYNPRDVRFTVKLT